MIKLLWIACSILVFAYSLKAIVKTELDNWGEVDGMTLIMVILCSFIFSMFGPFAILGYLIYTILDGVADNINKGYDESNNK